jgi:pimaricinolide synthase PimS1
MTALLNFIREAVAEILGCEDTAEVDLDASFVDLGFESLAAVELAARLSEHLGFEVPLTAGFDHPTPRALAEHLTSCAAEPASVSPPLQAADKPIPVSQSLRAADESTSVPQSLRAANESTSAPQSLRAADESTSVSQSLRAADASSEPIAIVGMSCRYPGGVDSPAELWELVHQGIDGTSSFPADRGWDLERIYHPDPDHMGSTYTRRGGFLADAGAFDIHFFGFSEREALATDPQQRLLLEAAWTALADAGIDPLELRGSPTGMFVGLATHDYYGMLAGALPETLEGAFGLGNAGSVASGRIAHHFGFEGPAVSVDTACSSSLVAIHLACESLRRGESTVALAGGVSVLASPTTFIEFSRHRALSPDGRCRSFAADADGTGWAEGVGVIVLEALPQALARGHEVQAVIRGSAINQDGASNGLTAPSGPAQVRLIRQALSNASLAAADIDAVEAHGTATTLGDPIEANALARALCDGAGRRGPLWVGSLKSNIGHAQAAAGVGGVIKMTQALRHELLPPTLHAEHPTPHVAWSAQTVSLLTAAKPWPRGRRVRRAGVSAFGVSGTNAHVILEEPPAPIPAARPVGAQPPPVVPWVLSAHTPQALREQGRRLRTWLVQAVPPPSSADLAHALARRPRLAYGVTFTGSDVSDLLAALETLEQGEPGLTNATRKATPPTVAMLFTGQGSQRARMGEQLAESFPVFSAALEDACEQLDRWLSRPLREVLAAASGDPLADLLHETEFTQSGLFAFEVALARLLESWGIRPAVVMGHSIGELTAAYLAGVFSLEHAAQLVAARGALMGRLPPGGAMVAVAAGADDVSPSLAEYEGRIAVASTNGPTATVISGEESAIEAWRGAWDPARGRVQQLRVSHAFHSPLVEPMLDELVEVARGLDSSPLQMRLISNLSGRLATSEELCDPGYWGRQARGCVHFQEGVRALVDSGASVLLEVGPQPVLSGMAAQCVVPADEVALVPTVEARKPESVSLMEAIGGLHLLGVPIDWDAVLGGRPARRVELPPYPFERRRYWASAAARPTHSDGLPGEPTLDHPFLEHALEVAATGEWIAEGTVSLARHPWLADHEILGAILLSGTSFVEMALRAAREVGYAELEELTVEAPLVLEEDTTYRLQLLVQAPAQDGRRELVICSQAHSGPSPSSLPWTRHAAGTLALDGQEPLLSKAPDVAALTGAKQEPFPSEAHDAAVLAGADEHLDVSDMYATLEQHGFVYGPAFRRLRAAQRVGEDRLFEVSLDDPSATHGRFLLDPTLLDAAFHPLVAERASQGVRVPFAWSGVRLYDEGCSLLRGRVSPTAEDAVALEALDEWGRPAVRVRSVVARELSVAALARPRLPRALFALEWSVLGARPGGCPGPVALIGASGLELADSSDLELTDAQRHPSMAALRHAMDMGAPPPARALLMPDRESTRDPAELTAATAEALQEWLADERLRGARLTVLTRRAVQTGAQAPSYEQAALWGLLRVAQMEYPDRFAVADLAGEPSHSELAAVLDCSEPQLAVRDDRLLVPRLVALAPPTQAPRPLAANETALVTGGTRGLGAVVARHLVAVHGVRHLILLSRRGAEGAEDLCEELRELGATVAVAACDVADRDALAEVLAAIPAEHSLRAVVHCAGVLDDALLADLTAEQVRRVLRPKLTGALNLLQLTEGLPIEAVVLFSSLAGLLGNPGQAAYAAANASLDALAAGSAAAGRRVCSIAWGTWAQAGGMTEALQEEQLGRVGAPLSTAEALALLDAALALDSPTLAVSRLEPAALIELEEAGCLPPVCRGLLAGRSSRRRSAPDLLRLRGTDRRVALEALVAGELAAVLGDLAAEEVDLDVNFRDVGLDSLKTVELRNRLGRATGLRLGQTISFDYPTPARMAAYLDTQIAAGEAPPDAGVSTLPVATLLDQLELAFDAAEDLNEHERGRLDTRLRALLARARPEDSVASVEEILLTLPANAQEIFDVIDNELGLARS